MAEAARCDSTDRSMTSQLILRIWHPNCWTLQTTDAVDCGLIAHGVYKYDGTVGARLTAYANTTADIHELIEEIETSNLTDRVAIINENFQSSLQTYSAGNATEELFVEYDPQNSIHNAFISKGFVPDERIRIHDGREYWTVIVSASRTRIQQRLDQICTEMNAEITISGIKSTKTNTSRNPKTERLSERQREIFELAQREGYYTWPRETSASNLAEQVDISKTTVLELPC